MKKISVLIAHYNNGRFFEDCYLSLIQQTYQNWEAIIVDDASTDNSWEILQSYKSQEKVSHCLRKRK